MPSATEVLFELGFDEEIKGVTHECTYPIKALEKPRVIFPSFDVNGLTGGEIDKIIRELSVNTKPIFIINSKKIKEIHPDLIISQNLCEVCAPFDREVHQIFSDLGYNPKNISINPKGVYDIFDSIIEIGMEIGSFEKAQQLVNSLTKRIGHIEQILKDSNSDNKVKKQKIICLEWISPFFIAGHWVPQMVEIVGGINGIGKTGAQSRVICMDDLIKYEPDKVIVMPCGFDMEKTCNELMKLNKDEKWKSLKAVKQQETYVVDANSFFSKPSPRIVTGIEILAKILHPNLFGELKTPNNSYKRYETFS